MIRRFLRMNCMCLALAIAAGAATAQNSIFTYQGALKSTGSPVTGTYDFKFDLYDSQTGGNLLGTDTASNVAVSDGIFTAEVYIGNLFSGAPRWLEISARPSGGGAFTAMTPRQHVAATPYAIGLALPFVGDANTGVPAMDVTNHFGAGIKGTNTLAATPTGAGVLGTSTATNGTGVSGIADTGAQAWGVYGQSFQGIGVRGYSHDGYGVSASSVDGIGVYSFSPSHAAVSGESTSGAGAEGTSSTGPGLHGKNTGSNGIVSAGVVGESTMSNGNGVAGIANTGGAAYAIYGQSSAGYAGYFSGKVHVNGTLSKSAGSFKIDHPLDPANKYLYHSFVESPDMMNVYNGVVTTDARGYAVVTMPEWFETLNRDFRYQLTVVDEGDSDAFVQAKVVGGGMHDSHFSLRTSAPNATVSWQVTGIRQDAWANAHRIPVEEDKPDAERGYYLHPELYGFGPEAGMEAAKANAPGATAPAAHAEKIEPATTPMKK